jgi:hypothetical protein
MAPCLQENAVATLTMTKPTMYLSDKRLHMKKVAQLAAAARSTA